jgi:hypothetical protein
MNCMARFCSIISSFFQAAAAKPTPGVMQDQLRRSPEGLAIYRF